jgi:hypothetical protein
MSAGGVVVLWQHLLTFEGFFFVVAFRFLAVGRREEAAILFRFLPPPRNFFTIFRVDSDTCLEMMSCVLLPRDLSAISAKILPPFRIVSFPRIWAPLQSRDLTTRHRPPKMSPSSWPLCTNGGKTYMGPMEPCSAPRPA